MVLISQEAVCLQIMDWRAWWSTQASWTWQVRVRQSKQAHFPVSEDEASYGPCVGVGSPTCQLWVAECRPARNPIVPAPTHYRPRHRTPSLSSFTRFNNYIMTSQQSRRQLNYQHNYYNHWGHTVLTDNYIGELQAGQGTIDPSGRDDLFGEGWGLNA